jgi:beta-lactamase class D
MKTTLCLLAAAVLLFSSCASNNVTVDDSLGHYFDSAGVKGCFALLDNGQGHFTIYNLPRYRDSLYPPGATFDIVQSLIALQTGVLKDDESLVIHTMPIYDTIDSAGTGRRKPDSAGNYENHIRLRDAFQSNLAINDIAFWEIASNLGIDTLKKWVDSLHYGNMNLSGHPRSFWFDDSLKITADEQLGLTKKLYFNQLPFFTRTQELVRDMMPVESNANYKLVYKTCGLRYRGHFLGWAMGWVEENKHPYFFVLNIETPDPNVDIRGIGLQLVKKILARQGFFQGTK